MMEDLLGKEWSEFLPDAEKYIIPIRESLSSELKIGMRIFPAKDKIFRVFKELPPDKVNVIWLGQDPYPVEGQATGRSFECGKFPSPSWRKISQIYKEEVENYDPMVCMGSLDRWVDSGVLLLNKALTVREGMPNSHTKIWEPFTKYVLSRLLNDIANPKAIVLLGTEAQKLVPKQVAPHKIFAYEHPVASSYQNREWRAKGLFTSVKQFINFNSKQINW